MLLLGVPAATVWKTTPSGEHVQTRVIAYLQERGARLVSPEDIPPRLAQAIVAIEDERFYQHHGVDTVGIARAALFDVTHWCWCEGASTITQQLVKDVYLHGSDRGFKKVIDATIALKVESIIPKDQILADYLSEIPTGPDLYGVEEASCTYFGAPISELDLAEDALLAGLAQAPSAYDPLAHPHAAGMRRSEVLNAMLSEGYVTAQDVSHAEAEAIVPRGAHSGC